MKIKVTILKLDKIINRPIIRLTNNRPLLFKIYYYTILQLRILLFFITGGKRGNIVMGKLSFQDMLDEACLKFGTNLVKKQRKDILACYVLYGIDPTEYFLYHFDKKDHDSRREFLSDRERMFGCVKMMSWKTFEELKEKDVFYHLASKFFNRDVCIIKSKANKKDFNAFVTKHPIFFGKPITGTLGVGADIYCISKYNNNEDAFEYFLTKGFWILEEIIKQDAEMASFNESSVNTIRIPSFITKKGEHVILNPTIRTGRKGSVVDNAGAGGITAMIDIKTGIIVTEAIDKKYNRYKVHPDSGKPFVGTQIPRWNELVKIVEMAHRSLPSRHRYVGFDFALSEKGWQLIEGNWGQLIGSQTATQKGIRYQFESLMGLPEDSCFE